MSPQGPARHDRGNYGNPERQKVKAVRSSSPTRFRVLASARSGGTACSLPITAAYAKWTVAERRARPSLAPARVLFERLATIAAVSPDSPLSFVGIRILGRCSSAAELTRALAPVADALARLLTALDSAGMLDGRTVGVILQGRGARSASRFERRLRDELRERVRGVEAWRYEVSVATGCASQAELLATAVFESLPEAG